jgi:hypothetical protein
VAVVLDDPAVCDNAVCALCCVVLGNVAGAGARQAAIVVECGGADAIVSALERRERCPVEVAREALWALGELCTHPRDSEWPSRLLSVLGTALDSDALDPLLAEEACWCVAAIARGGYFGAKAVIESELLARVVCLLQTASRSAAKDDGWVVPALRAVARVSGGSDAHADAVVESGVLVPMRALLGVDVTHAVRREAYTVVANLCAGSPAQLRAVFDAGIVPTAVDCCCVSSDVDEDHASAAATLVRIEAGWTIAAALSQATIDQVVYLMQLGAAPALLGLLPVSDAALALAVCKAVRRALRVCATADVDHAGCIDDGAVRLTSSFDHRQLSATPPCLVMTVTLVRPLDD